MVDNDHQPSSAAGSRSRIPAVRPITTTELAAWLVARLDALDDVTIGAAEKKVLERWFAAAAVIPGERIRWLPSAPAAGLAMPHYLGLTVFNRAMTRERYWAAFFYSALKSDLEYAAVSGEQDLAGPLLDRFLATGLTLRDPLLADATSIKWSVDEAVLASSDPELYVPAKALLATESGAIPSAREGMSDSWLAGVQKGELYDEFLCPGMVIMLRRAIRLVLTKSEMTNHTATGELLETILVNHAAFYYVSGMRVMNGLSAQRVLPPDCASCWRRFQPDLRGATAPPDKARWQADEYNARGSASEAEWIEHTCANPNGLFLNAGRKEHQEAKDLARLSLEDLRHQLADYTVNRIMLKVARDVARDAAGEGRPGPSSIADVYEKLDQWYDQPDTRLMLAVLWKLKINEFLADKDDVPGAVIAEAERRLVTDDPRALESIARYVVAETILSTRAFTRYREVLHSMLGGGALPSNQDPKGFMARGGSRSDKFHLSLNDRALEALVAIAALEAKEAAQPLSFQGFVDFLASRYRLFVDRKPSQLNVAPGLVADAAGQSREHLRSRLSSMGLLQEFSDSSDWNRVHWGPDQ